MSESPQELPEPQAAPASQTAAQAQPASPLPPVGPAAAADQRRSRYIRRVVLGYALLALAWIFLSDQLLSAVVGADAMLRISSAKGFFFVLVSALAFYLAMGGVPDRAAIRSAQPEDAIEQGLRERWPVLLHYLFGVAVVGAMLVIHRLIDDSHGANGMLVLFTLPITLAALLGGLGPGLAATALAAVLTGVYVLPPVGEPTIQRPSDLFQWTLLLGSGIAISLISESLQNVRERDLRRFKELDASHAALQVSEARVQQLFDDAPVAMNLVGWDGRFLSQNHRFTQLFGYTREDLATLDDWWRLAYPDEAYREEVRRNWDQQLEGAPAVLRSLPLREARIRTADGRELVIQVAEQMMGQGILNTFIDVTEQRRVEQRLRLWAETFERAQVGLAVADARSNRFTGVNPAFAAERGYAVKDLVGQPIATVFPPTGVNTLRSIIAGADASGHGVFETEHETRDGRVFPVLVDVTSLRDADGRPLSRIVFALDLTERRRAEQALAETQAQALEQQNLARIAALNQMQDANAARQKAEAALRALRESESRLALFIAHAPAALAMFDRSMCYIAASRRWRTDYGLGDRDLRGLNHYEVFPEISEDLRAVHRRGLAGEVLGGEDYRFERADGTVQWLRWEMHPWLDSDGQVGGIVIFTEDITARKRAEDELHALNFTLESRVAERTAELATLNQSLESFVYSVSHDLKAPLRGVEGYSRFLLDDFGDRLGAEGRLFIGNIRDGVARMGELIDDLLAYSRMERRPLASDSLDLTALVHRVVDERATEIAERGVRLSLELPALAVQADSEGLQMVLRNLLENALKFTAHSAQPAVNIRGQATGSQVELSVADNGVGFDMKYHDRIFEIFQRLQRVEDYPGTGVGLALVRKAMDRMGGRVWAESAPNRGATFHLELPAARPVS
jgi:PAS domain S-box-containing protein